MTTPVLDRPSRRPNRRFFNQGAFPIKSKGLITALDWDGRILRLAQSAGRGGKAEVEYLAAERLEHAFDVARSDPAAAGACLAEALRRLKLKPGAVVMGIPRSLVFLRSLSLPPADSPEALVAMVYFQISRDLPFRPEDAVIDFQVNAQSPPANPPSPDTPEAEAIPRAVSSPKVEVLVAVVKREVVQFYERVAAAAGLKLAALGFQSYANTRGLQACWPDEGRGAVALVSLRQQEVIIDIIAGGQLLFSRTAALARSEEPGDPGRSTSESTGGNEETVSLSEPADAMPDDPALIGLVRIEVVRSLHNYTGSDSHQPVETILVAGETKQAAALVETLAEACRLPCRGLASVPVGVPRAVPDGEVKAAGALTAVGLALSAQDETTWPFDFLHPKRPPAPRAWRRTAWIAGGAAAVVLLAGGWGLRAALIHQRQKTKEDLLAQLSKAAGNRAIYRDMRIRAKTVHDWIGDRREWLDQWAALSVLLPDCTEVYVSSITAGARGVLHISLQARSGEILAQVDKRLREAGYELRPPAVTPTSDRYGYSFQTSLELSLPAKLKQDWKALKTPPRPADDGSLERKK